MNPPALDLLARAPADPFDLDRLIVELRSLLAKLEQLSGEPTSRLSASPEETARVRHYIASRRAREKIFGEDWFADPAWDLLLDLFLCSREHRGVSISSACIAAAVPPTTALRWIDKLTMDGAIIRIPDSSDRRRTIIRLSSDMSERVAMWVREYLPS